MYGFTILKQNDTQCSVIHLRDARPHSNPSIGLSFPAEWIPDGTFNPFIQDGGSIRTLTGVEKILSEFHGFSINRSRKIAFNLWFAFLYHALRK